MDDYIVKREMLKKFLEDVSRISNESYQERVWVRAEGPECDDIDDTISDFFNDGVPVLERYRDFEIWDIRHKELMRLSKRLKEFADMFDIHSPQKSTEKLIKLPQWQQIRSMAKEIVESFGSLTYEGRKSVLNDYLRIISGISDQEYQERIWIRGEGPECDDFTETVCFFFDIGDPVIDSYKDYGITESQYHLLVKFRNEFENFSRENDFPEFFIDTPEWSKIMEMAKEVLEAFDYHKDLGQNPKNGTTFD